ncbi:DNA ligase [Paludisphaera soli]|uniref:DNA ligase n=1 Tax=Paludisphaera soli TaxID=2712865 RepID=UPI0013EC0635|nr:DNA ligase [Paludisphaera soli]
MPDLLDGETLEIKGSGARPYVLKNTGGLYSCSCSAWRNQSVAIESRTCKHLRKLRGDEAELARVGSVPPPRPDGEAGGGEAKAGPPLLLAERWDDAQDLAGWWMSEKLDGVRAYWDGRGLISRLGNAFHAPAWFLEGFPGTPLDGELWIGRRQFQKTVGIVRRQDRSDHWKQVSYVAFDAPALDGPFEARLASVRDHVEQRLPPHLRAHEHAACEGVDHLRAELARVEALGGEGLMMRRPASAYEVGRSVSLLKVKSFLDAEARVLEHLPGAGRHRGRLGALLVELADGTRFSVGTGLSDALRERPPAVGALITFRYQELSEGGVPRFPSFLGVRHDVASPAEPGAAAAPYATGAATVEVSGATRRFELIDGGSEKFWEVARDGCEVTVRYGRIGTTGQAKSKTLADEAAAMRYIEGLVLEKTGKGYAEV